MIWLGWVLRHLLAFQLPPLPSSGGGRKGRGSGSGSPSGGGRRGSIVGDFAVRRSAYRPSGDLSDLGYTGGHALNQFFATHPAYRVQPTTFRFDPYRDADQRRILNGIVRQGTIMDLQMALVQAGLLDEDDVTFGYIDSSTEGAFSDVLAIANQHGMAWQDVLAQAAAGGLSGGVGGGGGGGGGGGLGPTVITLPNRDDVIRAAEDTGMAMTGERLDDDLRESVADSILDALRTHQERQVQRELAAGPGVLFTESAPDPGRLLEEEIRERAPGKVMSRGVREAMDDWFSALGGPV